MIVAEALSVDQKPSSPNEKARIKSRGGIVSQGRLMGDLGVARAFGDASHKKSIREIMKQDDEDEGGEDEEDKDLGPDDPRNLPLLICDPEITRTDLKEGQEEDAVFVLLACE
jgi:serine/threonine protein phosphatase PrpC